MHKSTVSMNRHRLVSDESKRAKFAELKAEAAACTRCPAMCERTAVLSELNGSISARIMFIGEAPGRKGADRTRVPFSGDQSGQNFDRFLATLGSVALDAIKSISPHDLTLKESAAKIHAWAGRVLVPIYHPSPQVLASHRREAEQLRDYEVVARAIDQIGLELGIRSFAA